MKVSDFDAIIVAGGQAPMFTYDRRPILLAKFVEFYESGRIACALCHGGCDSSLCPTVEW